MRTPAKLAAYGTVLVLAFSGALGVGSIIRGPVSPVWEVHGQNQSAVPGMHSQNHGAMSGPVDASTTQPGGLMISENGYTLKPAAATLPAGKNVTLTYRILGVDGRPVTSYEQSHDKDMHLIAVRRDTSGFQHVHPKRSADGAWSVPVDLTAGTWRIFADFIPAEGASAGDTVTLGADIAVAGEYSPVDLPAPSRETEVDGYTVTLNGDLVTGEQSKLTLSVSRDGKPVTDLQPYLAAYGHLVALRFGDLAYLHVHPAGAPGDGKTNPGPGITFYATVPSAGDYRLYLNFQHEGVVHTAEFTAAADRTGKSAAVTTGKEDTSKRGEMNQEDHSH